LHNGTAQQDDVQHKEGQRLLLIPMNFLQQQGCQQIANAVPVGPSPFATPDRGPLNQRVGPDWEDEGFPRLLSLS